MGPKGRVPTHETSRCKKGGKTSALWTDVKFMMGLSLI